jgi:acrylyl-CoA reductase (NADPH)
MIPSEFSAYYVERDQAGKVQASIRTIRQDDLPPGEILIQTQWSSLNYKDALAATGHPGVARRLPHVPGIDVAGVVVGIGPEVPEPRVAIGDEVLVTGYELGAGQWGGWSEYVRVPRDWVIKKPAGLSLKDCMALGTAGFTAAQCVDALKLHGIEPHVGAIVVTGATGGVGCIGMMLLGQLGYRVTAVTGKPHMHDQLRQWGASEILSREEAIDRSGKPLLPGRWAGVLDTVGGETLDTLIRQTKDHGCITAFILRGVTLAGITSSGCPRNKRLDIWERLAGEWRPADLQSVTTEIRLDQVTDYVRKILAGEVAGRTVIRF